MHPQHSKVHVNWQSAPQQRVETVLTFRPYLHNDWTLKGKQVVHCTSLCTALRNPFEFCDSDKSTTNAPYFSAAAFLHCAPTKATWTSIPAVHTPYETSIRRLRGDFRQNGRFSPKYPGATRTRVEKQMLGGGFRALYRWFSASLNRYDSQKLRTARLVTIIY